MRLTGEDIFKQLARVPDAFQVHLYSISYFQILPGSLIGLPYRYMTKDLVCFSEGNIWFSRALPFFAYRAYRPFGRFSGAFGLLERQSRICRVTCFALSPL